MEKNSFAESFDSERLKEWFFRQRRPLPWRENPSPYQVWVSEVMLQQTQVSVVIPYYLKWMEEFPTVEALARAPLEKVIKL
ncbi:MAG: A/G-specific adenine glycosylase, partial [Chlamydiia bacterium]|nr:A/G-specific adenine glycosylase [Chlamydiia bacterium]